MNTKKILSSIGISILLSNSPILKAQEHQKKSVSKIIPTCSNIDNLVIEWDIDMVELFKKWSDEELQASIKIQKRVQTIISEKKIDPTADWKNEVIDSLLDQELTESEKKYLPLLYEWRKTIIPDYIKNHQAYMNRLITIQQVCLK